MPGGDRVDFERLLERVALVVQSRAGNTAALQTVAELLRQEVPHYDWVGFYVVDREKPGELVLGPFSGAATEHVRIPFGKGICGQAAARRETFVVDDVSKETNYLSCNPDVKSEIVVPIFRGDRVVAELDIDSHSAAPFTEKDRRALQELCRIVTPLF